MKKLVVFKKKAVNDGFYLQHYCDLVEDSSVTLEDFTGIVNNCLDKAINEQNIFTFIDKANDAVESCVDEYYTKHNYADNQKEVYKENLIRNVRLCVFKTAVAK